MGSDNVIQPAAPSAGATLPGIHYIYDARAFIVNSGESLDLTKNITVTGDGIVIIGQETVAPSSEGWQLFILVDGALLHLAETGKEKDSRIFQVPPPASEFENTLHIVGVAQVTPGPHVVILRITNNGTPPLSIDHRNLTIHEGEIKQFDLIPQE